jgi:FecR protein
MTTKMSEPSDPLDGLLGGLKPRRSPPAQAQARAYATLKTAWQAQRRPTWQRYGGVAVAATVTAFAVNLWMMNPAAEDVCFGVASGANLSVGEAHVSTAGDEFCVSPDTVLRAEKTSRFQSADGVEYRLREGSEISWQSADRVSLSNGALYVATHGKGSLVIITPFGEIADIGTVFTTEVNTDHMVVALREGSVQIDTPRGRHVSVAHDLVGERVTVDAERVVAAPYSGVDASLEWIFAAHPGYPSARPDRVLEQIAGDLGLALTYASPDMEARLAGDSVEGENVVNLGPREALAVMAGVFDFSVSEVSGKLEIREPTHQN